MKSLMLLNARKRRKKARRHARRRVHATSMNPRRKRRSYPRVTRRKLKSGGRSVTVRSRKLRVRRNKSKHSVTIFARNPRRRRRMNPMGGNILSHVKGVFSKENLTVAAGGVGAAMLTNKILDLKKADGTPMLPMGSDENTRNVARLAYVIGIPVLGAIATRRFNPSLAKGMLIGGLINGMISGIKTYAPAFAKQVGFAEYLEYTPMSAVGATPGYSAINQFSTVRPMNSAFSNSSAFPADAWGR